MREVAEKIDFEIIAKELPFYLSLIDRDGIVRYINAVEPGREIGDIIGQKLTRYLSKEEGELFRRNIAYVFETGESLTANQELNIASEDRWVVAYLQPYKPDKNGNFDLILATSIKIGFFIDSETKERADWFKFSLIADGATHPIIQTDENLKIIFHNKAKSQEELNERLKGKAFKDFIPKEQLPLFEKIISKATKTQEEQEYEIKGYDLNGNIGWYQSHCAPIFDKGKLKGFIFRVIDITSRKLSELKVEEFNKELQALVSKKTEELEKANQEISALLKEMHHRVKNNFQIISSLLNLQSQYVPGDTKNLLTKAKNRINSMALVHEILYKKDENTSILSLDNYIAKLVGSILEPINNKPVKYTINITPKNATLDLKTMTSLGLIVNELTTNSLKYAFAKTNNPKIEIEIKESSKSYLLKYKDNGSGIKAEKKKNTFGKELINIFIDQLNGKYKLTSDPEKGVLYEIWFKN